MQIRITNCHTHIFTIEHVPKRFLPFGLTLLFQCRFFRILFKLILININPFSNRDLFHRYANFIEISVAEKKMEKKRPVCRETFPCTLRSNTNNCLAKNQALIFKRLRDYYPENTKFVVLPMDMKFMGKGEVKEDVTAQLDELYNLANSNEIFKDRLIPFIPADPRRKGVFELVKYYVEEKNFRGIKIYPPLGYFPQDSVLMNIYEYAEEKNIPVMAHCSGGPIRAKGLSYRQTASYTKPDNYIEIMEKYPKLRVCLAHFGGMDQWEQYLYNPRKREKSNNWLSKILDMMRSGKYPNLFADISYTIFRFEENVNILKVLLTDEHIRTQVLFGSDYYMVETERFSEKRLSMYVRATLGEDLFRQIAEINPEKYLFG